MILTQLIRNMIRRPKPLLSIALEILKLGIMGIINGLLSKALRRGQENIVDWVKSSTGSSP